MNLSEVSSVVGLISTVITIVALVCSLLGILLGLKRGLLHSLLRLGAVVLAFGTALLLTHLFRDSISDLMSGLIETLRENPTFQDLANASPSLNELITNLPGALAAPLLFLALFLLMNAIFYIVYKILKHLTVFGKVLLAKTIGSKLQIGRLVGAAVSCLASFLIVMCVLAPIAGYVSLADNVVNALDEIEIDEETDESIDDIKENVVGPLKDNSSLTVSDALLNGMVFDSITSCEVGGEKIVWSDEIAYLVNSYHALKPAIDVNFNFALFTEVEGNALRTFSDHFSDSELLPHIIADLLPAIAEKWNAGETFCGIPNPVANMGEDLQPLINSLFEVLETTTYETLAGDLDTMVELIATLAESGTFAIIGEDVTAQDIIATLSEEGLVSGLIDMLYANERMRPLVADISNLGFNAIGESMNIPENDDAVRDLLNAELDVAVKKAQAMESYEQQIATLSRDIEMIFTKYGTETDRATAELYAACILGVGPNSNPDPSAATVDYFEIISAALSSGLASASSSVISPVSAMTPNYPKVTAAVEAYLAEQGSENAKKALILANQIKGSQTLVHSVVTFEDILLSAEEMKNMSREEMSQQAKSLEDIIGVLSTVMVFKEDGTLEIDMAALDANALSDALYRLASTGTDSEGHEIHNLTHAITGVVKYALFEVGIDAQAAGQLVNHMTTVRPDGNQKNPIASAIAVLNIVQQSNDGIGQESIKESVTTLVKDLDKDSAKVLADCVSPNLLDSFGTSTLPTHQTDALVTVTKDIINNFGETADDMSPEQLEAETAYLQTIFDLAINAGSKEDEGGTGEGEGETTKKPLFAKEEGEDSKLNMTADGFVDTIKHSTVLQGTVMNETESMKTAINDSMPESDKAELVAAIEKDTELSDELKNKLTDIFGLGAIAQ